MKKNSKDEVASLNKLKAKRAYKPPALQEETCFERAVYAGCKLNPGDPQFCSPISLAS